MVRQRSSEDSAAALTIDLAGREIPFVLRRSKRRTIGLTIDHRGLRVGAPARAPLGDIEGLIRKHGAWILEKLRTWEQRKTSERLIVRDGLRIPFLGGELCVRLGVGANRALWSGDGCRLSLAVAPDTEPRDLLERALRERVRKLFAERLSLLAPCLGKAPPPFSLSSARTRWGSCNASGRLRFNWRLIFFPVPVIDYVVAHELAHLKEMNHGPRFWRLVEGLCPDWVDRRDDLKGLAPTIPNF